MAGVEQRDYAFRNGLRTWGIHQAWPDLPLHFRKYRLLLEYFKFHWPGKKPEGDLLILLLIIEEMLDELANNMEGTISHASGRISAQVFWRNPQPGSDVASRCFQTPEPISITEGKSLRMTPKIYVEAQQRKNINYKFSLYLKGLEGLLAVGSGPGATKIGIVNPFSKSADMIGWTLKKSTAGDVTPKSLGEETNEGSWGAQLHVAGCGLDKVDKKYVDRHGKFRGIARLLLRFGDGPNERMFAGTGWLVDNKTIATAGHCLYHRNLGFLRSVDATFGNELKNCTKVHGTHAVVHWGYYTVFAGKNDLGFIRLASSISSSDASPLPYIQTPRVAPTNGRLIARGYSKVSERPARLRSSECDANYDLGKTDRSLEYELDTDEGSSGSPIFDGNGNIVGMHVRTSHTKDGGAINKGVIIDEGDNNPAAFGAVLDHLDPHKMRALRGLFRGMSPGVMRYTPEKF
ncbi:hypothetical protein CEP53_004017 [Fusarium sp. AF-6]|nr:hypothetical protein CEP53_004017 [Fusarium sp. AF-6]